MPMRAKRPCLHINCNQLVDSGYCDRHKQDARQYDRDRGNSTQRGYGTRHRKIREIIIKEEPICRECLKHGIITPSEEMDHIDGNAQNIERENLQMLCKACHSRKTIREQGGFGNKNKRL